MRSSTVVVSSIFLVSFYLVGCSKTYHVSDVSSTNISQKTYPNLGIALSGGGSKSAPFAMGVLKQFVDNDWMKDVDIISSVSGGGYSAYHFYSKAIYLDKQQNSKLTQKDFFKCCELNASVKNCEYQEHIKEYQDLLSSFESEKARGKNHWDEIKSVGIVGEAGVITAFSLPFHHIANTVFDWKLELSPSQCKYNNGIVRAFGALPDQKNLCSKKGETFEDLKKITTAKKVPLWIINASNFGKFWWKDAFRSDEHNLSKSIFEITPYGFGSGEHCYANESPTNIGLDLPRAVLASSAFFDALGESSLQGVAFGVLHAFNLRWGIKIPNYTASKNHQRWHNILPWPFYYLDGGGSKITLADGGQSGDNLGIYSLIKRKTKNIIIVSGSQDYVNDKLKLEDLCKVDKFIRTQGLRFEFLGNPSIKDDKTPLDFYPNFCKKSTCKVKGSIFNQQISYNDWQQPIWKGYIKNKDNKKISTLFFIKAAIDKHDLTQNARAFNGNTKCKEKAENYECTNDNRYVKTNKNYPDSLLSFWVLGEYGKYTSGFPQTSTVITTLNSSQNLYRGYMDLGYYLSGYLKEDKDFLKIVHQKK